MLLNATATDSPATTDLFLTTHLLFGLALTCNDLVLLFSLYNFIFILILQNHLMGHNRRDASHIPQQDDIYSSSPTLSQLSNPSNDQLPGIDLSLDLDSPALVAREIGDMNNQLLMEEEPRQIFGRVLDPDDRTPLVCLSPPVHPSALHHRKDLIEKEELNDSRLGHTRSPVFAR